MTVFWKLSHAFYTFSGGLARLFDFFNYFICANAISARAQIGKSTVFLHRGHGCTVHFNAKIGEKCCICPNVMIGSKFPNGVADGKAPIIGNNVFIGTGAVVISFGI